MDFTQRVQELREQGLSLQEIITTLRAEGKEVFQKGRILYEDKRPLPGPEDVRQFIQAMLEAQKVLERMNTQQSKATISLDESKPVGLVFFGDLHIGGVGTAYDLLDRDFQIVRDTPGLYLIGTGDYKDNFQHYGTPPGMNEQLFPAAMQDAATLYYLGMVADKTLALVKGNHDHWTDTIADVDFVEYAARQAGAVYLGHGGTLTINLGTQSYKVAVRHHYRGTTKLNPFGGMMNLARDTGADIAVNAHLHTVVCSLVKLGIEHDAKDVALVRNGSYKVYDDYGKRIGGYDGDPRMPMVIIDPAKRSMMTFEDFRKGLDTLALLRR